MFTYRKRKEFTDISVEGTQGYFEVTAGNNSLKGLWGEYFGPDSDGVVGRSFKNGGFHEFLKKPSGTVGTSVPG